MKEIYNFKYKLKMIVCILLILTPIYSFIVFKSLNNYNNNIIRENKSLIKDDLSEPIKKIDSELLNLLTSSNDKVSNIPIIILYNYNDNNFKEELEKSSEYPVYNYKIITASSSYSSENEIYSFIKSPAVSKIVLDRKVYPLSFEKNNCNEKYQEPIPQQFPYTSLINQSTTQIGAPYLWDLGLNGSGVVVAVLDTGIDKTHPDLNDLDDNPLTLNDRKIINETSFIDLDFNGIPDENPDDKVGHGTHVAGIISGTGEASSHIHKGVASGSRLMNVKVLTTYGGLNSWIIKGIEYAAYGPDMVKNTGDEADIISMSLGGSGFIDDPVIQAVDAAWDLNITVVIAAGNSGDDFFTLDSPGLSAKAITVGAVDKLEQIADFSSRGPTPDLRMGIDICAPGVNIVSAQANLSDSSEISGNYTTKSGTSMATPFVAGAVALLLQAKPSLTPFAIKTLFMASAVDIGESSYIQGAGRLDIYAAYKLLKKESGNSRLNRLDLTESLYMDNDKMFGVFKTPFYAGGLRDVHSNGTHAKTYQDSRETYFAIRYNTLERERLYLSTDLIPNYPFEMRWLIQNSTHNIAIESLKTPDNALQIDIFYEFYKDSKWIRISFNISSIGGIVVKNTKFYYYINTFIYEFEKLDTEEDEYDDGEYIKDINALVAHDYYYDEFTNPKFGFQPDNYLGFSSVNKTIAFEVNDWPYGYINLINDELTNKSSCHGDIELVQKLLNTTISPSNNAFIPIVIAFGDNRTHFIENINKGKNAPFFNFKASDIAINTLSIPNPIYNGTTTLFNVSVTNVGFTPSSNFHITTYLNDVEINETLVLGLDPKEEAVVSINLKFNKTGNYNLRIETDWIDDEFEESFLNNKLERKIKVITPFLASFFPQNPLDNPMKLKYAGQFLYWNCCVLKGENFSNLKFNKIGNAKSFVSFNGNSADTIPLYGQKGQSYVNISMNIPKGLKGDYNFSLQLMNASCVISEVFIEFNLIKDLSVKFVITNMTIDDDGPEDEDGIVEGEEYGCVDFFVNSTESTDIISNLFMIIKSRNDTTIEINDYNIAITYYEDLYYNDSTWSDDDFEFTVPYNFLNSGVEFEYIFFAQIGYSYDDEFIPFFFKKFSCPIKPRTPGIPNLEFESSQYLDLFPSDFDRIIEPGEVGVMEVKFRNIGSGSALQIFNTNFTCTDSRVTIPPYYIFLFFIFWPIHIQWNGIDPGDITHTYNSLLVINLSSSIPAGTQLIFELEIEYCNITGDKFTEKIQFSYTIPSIIGGNGDDDSEGREEEINPINLAVSIGIVVIAGSAASILFFYIRKRKLKILKRKESIIKTLNKS